MDELSVTSTKTESKKVHIPPLLIALFLVFDVISFIVGYWFHGQLQAETLTDQVIEVPTITPEPIPEDELKFVKSKNINGIEYNLLKNKYNDVYLYQVKVEEIDGVFKRIPEKKIFENSLVTLVDDYYWIQDFWYDASTNKLITLEASGLENRDARLQVIEYSFKEKEKVIKSLYLGYGFIYSHNEIIDYLSNGDVILHNQFGEGGVSGGYFWRASPSRYEEYFRYHASRGDGGISYIGASNGLTYFLDYDETYDQEEEITTYNEIFSYNPLTKAKRTILKASGIPANAYSFSVSEEEPDTLVIRAESSFATHTVDLSTGNITQLE